MCTHCTCLRAGLATQEFDIGMKLNSGQRNPTLPVTPTLRHGVGATALGPTWGAKRLPCVGTKATGPALQVALVLLRLCNASIAPAKVSWHREGALPVQGSEWEGEGETEQAVVGLQACWPGRGTG